MFLTWSLMMKTAWMMIEMIVVAAVEKSG